jgi:hypothetical protein
MNYLIQFCEENGILHWIIAVLGIFSLVIVRLLKVKNFSIRYWVNENIIGFIWSVFILSLLVTLCHEYFDSFSHIEAFLSAYCGTHIIFRIHKKNGTPKKYFLKRPHTN